MIRTPILLGLVVLSMLSACKKEDARTKEELLLAHQWRLTAEQRVDVIAGGSPVTTNSVINCNGGCSCDNYIAFLPEHRLERNEGPVVCPNLPQTESGRWYIDQKDQTLIATELTGYDGFWAFTIEDLSDKTLKVSHQIVNGTTVSTFRSTFSAQ